MVAVVGITSELEGEEMQVQEPGFKGGDRTSLDLPKPEEDLLEARGRNGQAAGGGAYQRQRARRELGQGIMPTRFSKRGIPAKKAERQWRETLVGQEQSRRAACR